MFMIRLMLLLTAMVAGVFVARVLWRRVEQSQTEPALLEVVPPIQEAP